MSVALQALTEQLPCNELELALGTIELAIENASAGRSDRLFLKWTLDAWQTVEDRAPAKFHGILARLRAGDANEVRRALREHRRAAQTEESEEWGEPLPLVREPEAARPYPLAALREACPLLGAAVEDVARAAQAHPSVAGAAVLTAAALVAQALHDVAVGGRRYPLSLFALTVAASGERKSECDALALRAVREFERDAQIEYRANLAAADEKSARPMNPRRLDTDPTLEGVTKSFEDGCPSRLIACADAGLLTGGFGMARENRMKTAAGLTLLFDGAPISRTRSTSGEAVTYYGRRLSMHLAGQPAAIGAFVNDPLLRGQGLLARCLLAIPPILAASRRWASVSEAELAGLAAFRRWQLEHLARPLPTRCAPDGSPTLELDPAPIPFTPAAMALFVTAYDSTQAALSKDGPLAPIREFGARMAEHVARLAGLFACANGAPEVGEREVRGALGLVQWYADEWLRAADASADAPELAQAEALLKWIAARGQAVTLRDLYRTGPRFVRSVDRARELLDLLARHRLIRPAGDAFEINPKGVKDGA